MEVEIIWKEKKEVVTLKKLKWGEYKEVLREAMGKIKMIGSTPSMEMDYISFAEQLVLRSIEKAPFEITMQSIQELPPEAFSILVAKSQELNPLPL